MDTEKKCKILNLHCTVCGHPQWNASTLENHLESTKHDAKCQICDVSLRHTTIRRHMGICEQPLRCGLCNELVSSKEYLAHKYNEHAEKPFHCPMECGSTFASVDTYKRKRKKHHCGYRRTNPQQGTGGDGVNVQGNEARQVPEQQDEEGEQMDFGTEDVSEIEETEAAGGNLPNEVDRPPMWEDWREYFATLRTLGCKFKVVDTAAVKQITLLNKLRELLVADAEKCMKDMGTEVANHVKKWLQDSPLFTVPKGLRTKYLREKADKESDSGSVTGRLKLVPVSRGDRPGKHGPSGYAEQYNRSISASLFEVR